MNMMLINNECFRDDVKPFIVFRKFFVTVREFMGQFFIGQPVLDNACRLLYQNRREKNNPVKTGTDKNDNE